MVGTRRIPGRRSDAPVFLLEKLLLRERLALAVAPLVAHALVKALGKGFGQPIGKGLGHDGVVVVVLRLERIAQLLETESGAHREAADVVGQARAFRRYKITERPVRVRLCFFFGLLAKEPEAVENVLARAVGIELDVVSLRVRRKEAIDTSRPESFLRDDVVEQNLSLAKNDARLFAVFFMLQNLRVDTAKLPGVKERRPIDVCTELRKREVLQHAHADKFGHGDIAGAPFDGRSIRTRRIEREQLGLRRGMQTAQLV